MLDASGLTKDQQNMVLTSIGNSRDFDKVAQGLIEQHGQIHSHEGKKTHKNFFAGKAFGKGGKGKGKGKGKRRAFMAMPEEDQDEEDDEILYEEVEEEYEEYEPQAYAAQS